MENTRIQQLAIEAADASRNAFEGLLVDCDQGYAFLLAVYEEYDEDPEAIRLLSEEAAPHEFARGLLRDRDGLVGSD